MLNTSIRRQEMESPQDSKRCRGLWIGRRRWVEPRAQQLHRWQTSGSTAAIVKSHFVHAVGIDDHEVVSRCRDRQGAAMFGAIPMAELDAKTHLLQCLAHKRRPCPMLAAIISVRSQHDQKKKAHLDLVKGKVTMGIDNARRT